VLQREVDFANSIEEEYRVLLLPMNMEEQVDEDDL